MFSATMSSESKTTYMLDSDEIRADERDVVDLAERTNNTRMINTRDEDSQKVGQEGRLFLKVERQRLIITIADNVRMLISRDVNHLHLHVGGPHNHVLKLVVFPGVGRAFYHRQSCIVLKSLLRHNKRPVKREDSQIHHI
jgi:hypothetical protein